MYRRAFNQRPESSYSAFPQHHDRRALVRIIKRAATQRLHAEFLLVDSRLYFRVEGRAGEKHNICTVLGELPARGVGVFTERGFEQGEEVVVGVVQESGLCDVGEACAGGE